jgi:hypothetical protein
LKNRLSSSATKSKIFKFNVGPNLRNAGIDKWILDLNNNEFVVSFNADSKPPIKSTFSKSGNTSQFLIPVVYSIADAIGKPHEYTNIKAIAREVVETYSHAIVNGLAKLLLPEVTDEEEESSTTTGTTTTITGKSRRKKKKKGKDATASLSPSEIEDNKAKEQYRQDVIALRTKFENDGLTYDQWCALVAKKYFKLKETVEKNITNAWEIIVYLLDVS